ncbi:MAG: patatin-like phospholipase family protein, partial [Spirochaetales bacterium]|nr:patatin-like phospholipase family protein [Spirochaetales bacterium]
MSISDFFRRHFGKKKPQIQEPETIQTPEPIRPKERFILTLDGGGMRGIIPVVLLQKLESCIRDNDGTDDIATYFDLISGTSTGGLISLALSCESALPHVEQNGSRQIDLEALLKNYMTMGKEIFQAQSSIFGLRQFVSDKYHSSNIQNLCQRWFGARLMDSAKVPTMIMAYDLSKGKQKIITSYAEDSDCPVWVAARATSAAPTYFSPIEYKGELLVDGGVIANNPALYAYFEAKALYPDCEKFHILSVSTGGSYHTMRMDSTRGLMNWADQVSPMYSTAQKRTTDFVINRIRDVDYVRIDDPLPNPVKMDETNPTALEYIRRQAKLTADKNRHVLKDFAKKLVENMEEHSN